MRENEGGANLPSFLSAANYSPFISKDLEAALRKPTLYRMNAGAAPAYLDSGDVSDEDADDMAEAQENGK